MFCAVGHNWRDFVVPIFKLIYNSNLVVEGYDFVFGYFQTTKKY